MAEPTSTAATVATATGVTIFGVSMGIQLEALLPALAGALLAMGRKPEPMKVGGRCMRLGLATLIGGYLTPLVVALAQRIPGNDLPIAAQLYTLACAAGYVAFRHFGDAIDAGAERFHKLIKPNTGKS